MTHHTQGPTCPYCSGMVATQGHPELGKAFILIKSVFNDCHISQVWRDEVEQMQDYADGKSHALWPDSKHNVMENGQPCSHAMDLFQIDDKGQAIFSYKYYQAISQFVCEKLLPIAWGGSWTTFKDYPHFELDFDIHMT